MRYLLPVLILLTSCHIPQQTSLCQYEGTTILTDHLDGCNWLIKMSDGRKLLPQNAVDFDLSDQQVISFSYLPFEGMSICMAEDEMIILTCLQPRAPADCQTFADWQQISWMRTKVDTGSIKMIVRHRFNQGYLYSMTESDGKISWYNCQGQKICNQDEGCDLPENELNDPVTIFLAQR